MAEGYPDRMAEKGRIAIEAMVEAQRLGQKNGRGFYTWTPDKKGPPKKSSDPAAKEIVAGIARGSGADIPDEQIVLRMMLPMLIKSSRCLEERIVGSPVEVDIAVLYGLGFPPFRGGLFRWADDAGIENLVRAAEQHRALGALYTPTQQMQALAGSGKGFHGE